jgi:hypothetical protein
VKIHIPENTAFLGLKQVRKDSYSVFVPNFSEVYYPRESKLFFETVGEYRFFAEKINETDCRIITVMSDNGNVYPSGNLSVKLINNNDEWYKIFTIEEQLGYLFSSLLIDNSYSLNKKDLNGYLLNKSPGIYEFHLDQSSLISKNNELKKLDFKIFDFIFEKTRSIININFIAKEDYYYNKGKQYIYENELPEGFKIKLNGSDFGNINNGINLAPGTYYEIEIINNGDHYTLDNNQQMIFKGKADQNEMSIDIEIYSKEYICSFSGYENSGIIINGDSSRVCYYKQSIVFEFSYEKDEDAIPNWLMSEKISINGQKLKNWISNIKYNITLEGGGHIKTNNNYFLTINNIDQDFNIKFEE